MNRIEEMIKEMCPDGVRRVKLGEVCNSIKTGKLNANAMDSNGLYPFFTCDANPTTINNYAFDTEAIIVTGNGSQVGHINYYKGKFNAYQRTYVLSDFVEVNIFFALHYFKGYLKDYIMANSKKGSIPYITLPMLQSFEIPLPPLPIQQEIVKILDSFTALQQNLEDELKLRQKQYEHYREKLLTFEDGEVEWKKLGDIGKMTRGTGLMKSDFTEEGYPCIHYGQVHTYYGTSTYSTKSFCSNELAKKLKKAKTGNLIIATTSEDVEACCKAVVWLGDGEVAYSGDSFCFAHNQNPKYIAYLFQTEQFARQKRMVATGAKVVRVSGEAMEKFIFPFPSLEKQNKIVQTLDHFESLISNLKTEIELRKKQYEYYREKLLTFE